MPIPIEEIFNRLRWLNESAIRSWRLGEMVATERSWTAANEMYAILTEPEKQMFFKQYPWHFEFMRTDISAWGPLYHKVEQEKARMRG
jgi:hypothetical protein